MDEEDTQENLSGAFDEEAYEEEITYKEIMANLSLNGELIITIPTEEEAAVKTGLKNLKAKMSAKLKEDGLPVPDETLEFSSTPAKDYEDCIRLRIILKKKGTVKIKKMEIPDGDL